MVRRIVLPLLLAAMVLVFGCATQPQPDFRGRTMQPVKPIIKSDDYRVGPSDVLEIEVRGQEDLSRAVVVRPDGKVTLSLIGDVYVSGMSAADIDARLTRMYTEYIVGADVMVAVVAFNSKEIYVWGQVAREGPQTYTGEMTIVEAISRAGGTLVRAEPKAVQVTRGNKVWKVNLDDIVIRGRRDQNIYLQPGDIVFVPLNGFARAGYALDNIFFPIRSFFSFVFLGESVDELKDIHKW